MSDYSKDIPFSPEKAEEAVCPCCHVRPEGKEIERNGWKFVQCSSCGSLILNPRPKQEFIDSFYKKDYDYAGVDISFDKALKKILNNAWVVFKVKRYLKVIKKICVNVKLLDYGCGFGQFLIFAKKEIQSFGFELSERGRKTVENILSLPVTNAKEKLIKWGPFSVITSFHVFEHLSDPGNVLNLFHDMLEENGILLLVVPHGNSLARKAMGSEWEWCAYPVHNVLFTKEGLKKIVEECGFAVEKIYTQTGDVPSPFKLKKLRNRLLKRKNTLSNLKTTPAFSEKGNYGQLRKVYWKIMAGLFRLTSPLGLLTDPFLPIGDELVIFARKKNKKAL